VLGMNEKLAALLSPDLEPCELRGCKGYQHAE
jgi:hypothetical protein